MLFAVFHAITDFKWFQALKLAQKHQKSGPNFVWGIDWNHYSLTIVPFCYRFRIIQTSFGESFSPHSFSCSDKSDQQRLQNWSFFLPQKSRWGLNVTHCRNTWTLCCKEISAGAVERHLCYIGFLSFQLLLAAFSDHIHDQSDTDKDEQHYADHLLMTDKQCTSGTGNMEPINS